MLKACEEDLKNFQNRSEMMIKVSARMRTQTIDEYKESYVKSIEDMKKKLKTRILELGGEV
jgi:phage regulator Rha-like protein